MAAPFQGGQVGLQGRAGGVARAGILVSLVLPGGGLNEGGGLEDRGHDGAGAGIGFLPGMDGLGGDFMAMDGSAQGEVVAFSALNRVKIRSDLVRMARVSSLRRTITACSRTPSISANTCREAFSANSG